MVYVRKDLLKALKGSLRLPAEYAVFQAQLTEVARGVGMALYLGARPIEPIALPLGGGLAEIVHARSRDPRFGYPAGVWGLRAKLVPCSPKHAMVIVFADGDSFAIDSSRADRYESVTSGHHDRTVVDAFIISN